MAAHQGFPTCWDALCGDRELRSMGTLCVLSHCGQAGIGITPAGHPVCWALLLWDWGCGRKILGGNANSQPSWW